MITINSLKVNYGEFTALDISQPITIAAGDRIGIIGGNGAGKSTFVKALSGLVNYEGEIKTELKQSDITLHMQENAYIDRMPTKLIIEAILNTDIKTNPKLTEMIKFFDFEPCLKKRFSHLSGGQKQKLTIILVLMQDTPFTIFDEVTSGLDFETRQKLMQKIVEWYKGKTSALAVVSHYYDELDKLVNKLLIIDKGRVVAYGDVDALFQKYCSSVIIIIDNNEVNTKLMCDFKKIKSPAHLLAIPCATNGESAITALLTKHNINYKRSNRDLEILFVNACDKGEAQ